MHQHYKLKNTSDETCHSFLLSDCEVAYRLGPSITRTQYILGPRYRVTLHLSLHTLVPTFTAKTMPKNYMRVFVICNWEVQIEHETILDKGFFQFVLFSGAGSVFLFTTIGYFRTQVLHCQSVFSIFKMDTQILKMTLKLIIL